VKILFKHIIVLFFLFPMLAFANNASIVCKWVNTPDNIKGVVLSAFHTISKELALNVNINVNVVWTILPKNVKANATASEFIVNQSYLPLSNTYYPISLAEQLNGETLNEDNADIICNINSSIVWNLDTNSTDFKNHDLYSVILHEFIHGLGFIGSIITDPDNTNKLIFENFPTIFDRFLIDQNGNHLDKNFMQISSNKLYETVTTNHVFFSGAVVSNLFNDSLIPLYTDTTYLQGRHIYHIDKNFFEKDDPNYIMSPFFTVGDSHRKIGDLIKAMLNDIGWEMESIEHEPPHSKEDILLNDTILFSLKNSSIIDTNSIMVDYSFDEFEHSKQLNVNYDFNTNSFFAIIEEFPFNHNVSYRILFNDRYGRTLTFPRNKNYSFEYYVGTDTVKPSVADRTASTLDVVDSVIKFQFTITDNISVKEAILYINYKNVEDSVFLQNAYTHEYVVHNLEIDDEICYSLKITDNANIPNVNYYPLEGRCVSIHINEEIIPRNSYSINFDTQVEPFFLDGFSISQENGFETKALHSQHPYISSNIPQVDLNFTSVVANPLILAYDNQYLCFKEVVLVEPAEIDAVFGERGFWDYVIVEGSIDKNKWYAFEKRGYDSNYNDEWLADYYSAIDKSNNNSSLAIGNDALFKEHCINLLANKYLSVGDTVFIRFRLLSDELTYAWGWAIDDIKTGTDVVDNVELVGLQSIKVTGKCVEIFNISAVQYEIFSVNGVKVNEGVIDNEECFGYLNDGLYIIKIVTPNEIFTERLFVH